MEPEKKRVPKTYKREILMRESPSPIRIDHKSDARYTLQWMSDAKLEDSAMASVGVYYKLLRDLAERNNEQVGFDEILEEYESDPNLGLFIWDDYFKYEEGPDYIPLAEVFKNPYGLDSLAEDLREVERFELVGSLVEITGEQYRDESMIIVEGSVNISEAITDLYSHTTDVDMTEAVATMMNINKSFNQHKYPRPEDFHW